MKKYIFVLFVLVAVAFSFAACNKGDDTTAAPVVTTAATTTTEKLTESQPTEGVKLGDVAEAGSPVERFAEHPALLLWEDAVASDEEIAPVLIPYISAENNGVIVLFQGTADEGGYYISEGTPVAEYLCGMGYDVFLCKYRLSDSYTEAVVEDAKRAVRYVRHHAAAFGIENEKVATMGFGTGALLAYIATCENGLGTPVDDIDKVSAKPDTLLLFNPDITPDGGMFADAAPAAAYPRATNIGIYYDATSPLAGDILRFAFSLRHEVNVMRSEVHGISPDVMHKEGGDRTDNYSMLYEMMKNYLKAYGF